jgi:hypothetical protein
VFHDIYEWAKQAGIFAIAALIAFQMLSAAVTHALRDRTPEDLARMKVEEPRAYKALLLCKSLGIDAPRVKIVLGLIFARAMGPTAAAPHASTSTPQREPEASMPDQTWPPPS